MVKCPHPHPDARNSSIDLQHCIGRQDGTRVSKVNATSEVAVAERDVSSVKWCKSSHCVSGNSNCVEVAFVNDVIFVRDSQEPGAVLCFDSASWRGFVEGIRAGEFDRPTEAE